MPKYMIHCSTVRSYYMAVEAPSLEAVEKFYSGCDGDEFTSTEEGGWDLDEIEENSNLSYVDKVINSEGEEVDVE